MSFHSSDLYQGEGAMDYPLEFEKPLAWSDDYIEANLDEEGVKQSLRCNKSVRFFHNGRLVGDENATVRYMRQNGLADDFVHDFFENFVPYEAVLEELAAGDFCGQTQDKLIRDGLCHVHDFDVVIHGFSTSPKFPGYFDRKGKKAAFKPLISFRRK